jgi:hypothetical protein
LIGSLVRSAQPEAQHVSPDPHGWFPLAGQTQLPAAQTAAPLQAKPQSPQLAASLCRSWQPLSQQVSGAAHGWRLLAGQMH